MSLTSLKGCGGHVLWEGAGSHGTWIEEGPICCGENFQIWGVFRLQTARKRGGLTPTYHYRPAPDQHGPVFSTVVQIGAPLRC